MPQINIYYPNHFYVLIVFQNCEFCFISADRSSELTVLVILLGHILGQMKVVFNLRLQKQNRLTA